MNEWHKCGWAGLMLVVVGSSSACTPKINPNPSPGGVTQAITKVKPGL